LLKNTYSSKMAKVVHIGNCLKGILIVFLGSTFVAPVSGIYSTVGRVTEIMKKSK
jgi:hypothetical protein